jgi:hypothetical protein
MGNRSAPAPRSRSAPAPKDPSPHLYRGDQRHREDITCGATCSKDSLSAPAVRSPVHQSHPLIAHPHWPHRMPPSVNPSRWLTVPDAPSTRASHPEYEAPSPGCRTDQVNGEPRYAAVVAQSLCSRPGTSVPEASTLGPSRLLRAFESCRGFEPALAPVDLCDPSRLPLTSVASRV